MDFELSSEQAAFRDLMRDFARRSISPVAREWELAGRYPTEIVEEMKAMGLFGMLVPEEYGGIGISAVSYSIVFEEISKAWMGVAGILGSHSLATQMLTKDGTEEQRQRWLPDLASGKRRSGIALTEPGAGSDLQGISTVARRSGDHYVVNGTKTWITNARHANPLPVLVKTDPEAQPRHKGMTILMIEQGTPGFSVGKDLGKLGYKGPESAEVHFNDCLVPAENVLGGREGAGLQQALSALEFATDVQAARLLTWWAASALDAGKRADLETGMAKLYASEVCIKASLESMRIHGGYGYSTEFEIERFYRDAPLMAIGEGTNDILRTVIARQLVRKEGT